MKDVFLAAAILLGACSSTVPGTVLKLASVDPLTADPADIALQASLPDGVGLLPRAGTLALRAELRDGSEKSGAFPVERVGDVLRVAPASHDALRALQADIAAWEQADPDGTTGSLDVDLEPCRRGADIPDEATLSVAIRLEAEGAFLPLIRDAKVVDLVDSDTIAAMPLCP